MEIGKLYITTEEELADKKINDIFTDEVFKSHFWLYWRTMFAFQEWSSAIEMKRYLQRFVHHIDRMPDVSCLKYTKFNQFESLIMPMVEYLKSHNVKFVYDTVATNVQFHITPEKKVAEKLDLLQNGKKYSIKLSENDLVFITNGSCTESSTRGDNQTAAKVGKNGVGACWDLWRNIASQSDEFGKPAKFCEDVDSTKWMSATVTITNPEIIKLISKVCTREMFTGNQVSGGVITMQDSAWLMSWSCSRQPHFKSQPKGTAVIWIDGLLVESKGDFVKKSMEECSGQEILQEYLYHIGAPMDRIKKLSSQGVSTIPTMMPFINAFFSPRRAGDRPKVVPDGAKNFAFLGQFTETPRDTVFTTEYSIRTGMEAVYTLLGVERGVPEVYASTYDIRYLLKATSYLLDGRKLNQIVFPKFVFIIEKLLDKKLSKTDIKKVFKEYNLI
ncbi:MAG: oleate hydratase, partial [Bifidobacteriaceae bacterium]|jgi:oleate hydratase|nr:oleate hydratase [Bifidobacteriaceae bacterium]